MKILQVLTYYRPHVSGLTIYVERLSRALVRQGHEVTVLTSQYDSDLPPEEIRDGVRIFRVPVAFRVSKGVIMPTIGHHATREVRHHDVVQLHLPQFDAPGLALRGRVLGKPVVLTYHCDLKMPEGVFNKVVNQVVLSMNRLAGTLSDAVVAYTRDYALHSHFASNYLGRKMAIIPPPVELAEADEETVHAFHEKHRLDEKKVIGISARLATEKGVEILLRALPLIRERHPNAMVLHAGPYEKILGEEAYAERLAPLFEEYSDCYYRLGTLHDAELTAFYRNLDVLTIPSLNSTESFGLVQIEAMMNGVPVVSSNLPGVRQPVTMTGMGEVVPIGDHRALAAALSRVLDDPASYRQDPEIIGKSFSPDRNASAYVALFKSLRDGSFDPSAPEPSVYNRLRALDGSAATPARENA